MCACVAQTTIQLPDEEVRLALLCSSIVEELMCEDTELLVVVDLRDYVARRRLHTCRVDVEGVSTEGVIDSTRRSLWSQARVKEVKWSGPCSVCDMIDDASAASLERVLLLHVRP